MKNHLPWIVIIFTLTIAFQTCDGKSIGLPPMVEPKRTSFEDLLQTFNIDDLESLTICQQKDSSCPIDKEALLNLVEHIYKVNAYVRHDIVSNNEEAAMTTPSTKSAPLPGIDTMKLKLQNHVTGGSLIYMAMQIHGAKLKRHEIQRLKELYTIANNSFANDLKIIKQNFAGAEENMKETIQEKALLDHRIDIIIQEIDLNLTNQEECINSIIAAVEQDQYLIAMTKFYKLNDTEMLTPLAERTENNEKLLNFLQILPSLSQRMIAYKAMFEKENLGYSIFGLYQDFKILKTQVPVFKIISNFSNKIDDLMQFENELKRKINGQIDQISVLIQTGKPENYSDFISYAQNHEELINAHLEELLDRLCGSPRPQDEIIDAIFIFAQKFTKFSQFAQIIGSYSKFGDLVMKDGNPALLLKIAYKVKQITSNRNFPSLPQKIKTKLENIKDRMPSMIQCFVSHGVKIRSLQLPRLQDYLLRESDSKVVTSYDRHRWQFEFSDDDNLFKIRHVETNEYLIMGRNVSQNESRKIFTSREPDNQSWDWEYLDDNKFLIKLLTFNEYLTVNPDKEYNNHYEASSCVDAKNTSRVENICNDPYKIWLIDC